MQLFDISIKRFLREKMYFHKRVLDKTKLGKKIIKSLFIKIREKPDKYINVKLSKKSNTNRIISDFIAGMTDRFAINLYNKSKLIYLKSI